MFFFSRKWKWVSKWSRLGRIAKLWGDSDVEQYLANNEGTRNYEELQNQTDVDAYKVFGKDNNLREKKGKFQRTFKQFKNKMSGVKSKIGFRKMKANVGEKGGESKCSKKSNPNWRK